MGGVSRLGPAGEPAQGRRWPQPWLCAPAPAAGGRRGASDNPIRPDGSPPAAPGHTTRAPDSSVDRPAADDRRSGSPRLHHGRGATAQWHDHDRGRCQAATQPEMDVQMRRFRSRHDPQRAGRERHRAVRMPTAATSVDDETPRTAPIWVRPIALKGVSQACGRSIQRPATPPISAQVGPVRSCSQPAACRIARNGVLPAISTTPGRDTAPPTVTRLVSQLVRGADGGKPGRTESCDQGQLGQRLGVVDEGGPVVHPGLPDLGQPARGTSVAGVQIAGRRWCARTWWRWRMWPGRRSRSRRGCGRRVRRCDGHRRWRCSTLHAVLVRPRRCRHRDRPAPRNPSGRRCGLRPDRRRAPWRWRPDPDRCPQAR